MLLKLNNPKIFSDVISIISELVSEVKLKVDKEGMSIVAVDPANVAMVLFKLPTTAFSQLEVESEELGVNLESLKAVLRRCSFGSSLIIRSEENFLKIEINDRVKREFSLSLIDLERKDKPIPNLEFTTKIDINSMDFLEAIEDCSIVADSCTLETLDDKFSIYSKGTLNSASLSYSSDEVSIISPSPCKGKYSLEYLMKMVRASKMTEKTVLNFSNDYPLRIDFKNAVLELSFILAPRVETED